MVFARLRIQIITIRNEMKCHAVYMSEYNYHNIVIYSRNKKKQQERRIH